MSELGNTVRTLRGNRTQREVAEAAGVNMRTLQRCENGEDVRLKTVRALSRYFKMDRNAHAALLVAWLRLELGEDFVLLEVRSRSGKCPALTDADKFLETFRGIPAKYQKELFRAMQREEVMRSIIPLNELYDNLTNGSRTP